MSSSLGGDAKAQPGESINPQETASTAILTIDSLTYG
jgi:hypothetical protein